MKVNEINIELKKVLDSNLDEVAVEWYFNGEKTRFEYPKGGAAFYNINYKLVVIMFYDSSPFLDMRAYNLDGELVSTISPSEEDITYNYLTINSKSKSKLAVVASYNKKKENFYDWYFEVDLDNFKISNCIGPAY